MAKLKGKNKAIFHNLWKSISLYLFSDLGSALGAKIRSVLWKTFMSAADMANVSRRHFLLIKNVPAVELENYLPIQKVAKMRPRISSNVVSPVMSPRRFSPL